MSISNKPIKTITYNGEPLELQPEGMVDERLITKSITEEHYYNDRLTVIRVGLFSSYKTMKSLTLPNVELACAGLCQASTGLERVSMSKCIDGYQNMFNGCTALTEVNLPSIKILNNAIFNNCTSLKKVVFESVTGTSSTSIFGGTCGVEVADFHVLNLLADGGLKDSKKLNTLIIRTPSVCKSSYANQLLNTPIANGEGYIYVPDELVDSYKVHTNWAIYAEQIKPLSELPEEV